MLQSQTLKSSSPLRKAWVSHLLFLLLLGALLFIRAWPRLIHPEVWVEDAVIVSDWIKHGLPSLTQVINGYLIVLPRLVSGLALSGSFVHYPAISTYLTWFVTLAICGFIAFAPSRLKGTKWVAAATLLIPSDPEAFGLPVYLLWWSAVLLFTILFWDRDGKAVVPRVVLIGVASLSSPACVATLPAYVLRGILLRQHKGEIVVAISATVFAFAQAYAMWPLKSTGTLSIDDLILIPQKFFGSYLVGNLFPPVELIAGIAGFLLLILFFASNMRSWPVLGLVYLLGVSVLMSITRVDIHAIHQTLAGPRYFFLPYILISWVLVQGIFIYQNTWKSWLAIGLLTLGVVNALPSLWRTHSILEWQKHAFSCAFFPRYDLPVHFDGSLNRQWHIRLSGAECAKLTSEYQKKRSFPFLQIPLGDWSIKRSVSASSLLPTTWRNTFDVDSNELQSRGLVLLRPLGPYPSVIEFQANRGQVILLRPEALGEKPTIVINGNSNSFFDSLPRRNGWIALELSNRSLPRQFTVKITVTSTPEVASAAIALQP